MKKINFKYFTPHEYILWGFSSALIIASFFIFDRGNPLTLIASLLGSTSIIINAKGNPLGQLLMVIFGVMYAIISYSCAYYGEMITYLGMTAPMAAFSFITWLRHPYKGNKAQVAVNRITRRDVTFMCMLAAIVTAVFYFILKFCDTANLLPSTISVTTTFVAVFLTYKRSPYFSLAYAVNDIVLILLWSLACVEDISYISVIMCFVAFLANDIYSFISWRKMERRQLSENQKR